jgi:hypothetical protein
LHADGGTDVAKLIAAFRNFANSRQKSKRHFIGDRNVPRHKNSKGNNQLSLTGNFARFLQKLTSKAHTHTHTHILRHSAVDSESSCRAMSPKLTH